MYRMSNTYEPNPKQRFRTVLGKSKCLQGHSVQPELRLRACTFCHSHSIYLMPCFFCNGHDKKLPYHNRTCLKSEWITQCMYSIMYTFYNLHEMIDVNCNTILFGNFFAILMMKVQVKNVLLLTPLSFEEKFDCF